MQHTIELEKKLNEYYENFYRHDLRLPDFQRRISERVAEENDIGRLVTRKIEGAGLKFENKDILIVGAGTGAELFHIAKNYTGAKVWGIEPYDKALEILHLKKHHHGRENVQVDFATAELLPYANKKFDIVICYTVLEHVQNVEQSLREMTRVCKTGGNVFISTPNYMWPFEEHFKVVLPPPAIFPKLAKNWLKLRKRYTQYFDSLNLYSKRDLDRILDRLQLSYVRLEGPIKFHFRLKPLLQYIWYKTTGISKSQIILIKT